MIVEITPPGEHRRQFVVIELQGLVQARKGERLDGQTLGTLRFKQVRPSPGRTDACMVDEADALYMHTVELPVQRSLIALEWCMR
jgi:hypothetical protein